MFAAACSGRTDRDVAPPAAWWQVVRDEPREASGMRLADGLVAEVFAQDPHVVNPVALHVDDLGRVHVAETHRYLQSVFDVTQHPAWVRDDLALRSVDDRRAFLERTFADTPEFLVAASEQVRTLCDDDRDGRADRSTVLAAGFDAPTSGTAAGILAVGTEVWFACVPDLVRMVVDPTATEVVAREVLHTGYGVHVGVTGHDLHGLVLGPDGRIYLSMGDRGARVRSREGEWIDLPDTGAVLRCEPDGSDLEVVATGLRNPQELAFDATGNLFTADNDTAGADRARVVHVVAGGDYGWRCSYQHMDGFGPWVREDVWRGGIDGFLPGAGFAAQGPAGLDFHPGTGFDPAEAGRFVLCDFPKGVLTFGLERRGASFAVGEVRWLIEDVWAPDAMFGPDGALWVADWTGGWGRPDRGRVHRVFRPGTLDDPAVVAVRDLLRRPFPQQDTGALLELLAHADLRVRQRAHLELARRADAWSMLAESLVSDPRPRVRLHALWALAVAARRHGGDAARVDVALADPDPEVRARAARCCGELQRRAAAPQLAVLLGDENAAVQFEAAIALGAVGDAAAVPALVGLAVGAADGDPFLLHAAVEGLRAVADERTLADLAARPERAARRAGLLALRRRGSPQVAVFLDDPDPGLRVEAVRAIHDVPTPAALAPDGARLDGDTLPAAARSRAIAAARRTGRAADAARLADVARDPGAPADERAMALTALAGWAAPDPVDPVLGLWRPLAPRDPEPARRALAAAVGDLGAVRDERVVAAFVGAARALGVVSATPLLAELAADATRAPALRGAALTGLAELAGGPGGERTGEGPLGAAVEASLASGQTELVESALRIAPQVAADRAGLAARIVALAGEGVALPVRQRAIRALGALPAGGESERVLLDLVERLDELPAAVRLDVLEAAEQAGTPGLRAAVAVHAARRGDDPLARWRVALDGGDVERGRAIFAGDARLACQRCHAVGGVGGNLGPSLDRVGAMRSAEEILESVLFPSARLTAGYPPAMPDVARHVLDRGAIRDLIAFLRSLR